MQMEVRRQSDLFAFQAHDSTPARDMIAPMNYRRGVPLCFLAATISACALGQSSPSGVQGGPDVATWKTGGFFNGRFWQAAPDTEKATFLMAYADGLRYAAVIADRLDKI